MARQHSGQQSTYHVRCEKCGEEIVTCKTEGVCRCGVEYRLEWQAKLPPVKPTKTITEVYGE